MENEIKAGVQIKEEQNDILSSIAGISEKMNYKMPNLLLVAGNGRNVGKTTLACRIIKQFANKIEVTGLKISPHFHNFNETNVIYKSENVVIAEEKQNHAKDSSRMLQAGARQVFFAMARPGHLPVAIKFLYQILPANLIVCESGGLHELITPGLFFMVKRKGEEIVKTHLLRHSPILVNYDGENFDFDIQLLYFDNSQIKLRDGQIH